MTGHGVEEVYLQGLKIGSPRRDTLLQGGTSCEIIQCGSLQRRLCGLGVWGIDFLACSGKAGSDTCVSWGCGELTSLSCSGKAERRLEVQGLMRLLRV